MFIKMKSGIRALLPRGKQKELMEKGLLKQDKDGAFYFTKNETQSSNNTTLGQFVGMNKSKKFHLSKCRSLPTEQNRIYFNSREEAINAGYTPCGICKP